MQTNNWTLIDKDSNRVVDELHIAGGDVSQAAAAAKVEYRRLHGGRQAGLHMLSIDNGAMRISIIPERGMGIWKAWSGEVELGWQSPIDGPVHPNWVPLHEPTGLGWLEGFDELLVRCGLYSNGAPEHDERGCLVYPLHGKIAQAPAHHLEVTIDKESGEIVVRGIIEEKRFLFYRLQLVVTLRLHPDRPTISIRDEITNLASVPGGMQLLYHINFGPPLLSAGAELFLPVKQMAPRDLEATRDGAAWSRYDAATSGYKERVHFFELLGNSENQTHVLLKNAESSRGVSLHYDITQLPCFAQWKHTGSLQDGYVTGLEPATNFPNPRSFEADRGRVVPLAPGETRQFDLCLHYHDHPESVATAQRAIEVLAEGEKPFVHPQPKADWSFEGS